MIIIVYIHVFLIAFVFVNNRVLNTLTLVSLIFFAIIYYVVINWDDKTPNKKSHLNVAVKDSLILKIGFSICVVQRSVMWF
jgi:hypothetical protein